MRRTKPALAIRYTQRSAVVRNTEQHRNKESSYTVCELLPSLSMASVCAEGPAEGPAEWERWFTCMGHASEWTQNHWAPE